MSDSGQIPTEILLDTAVKMNEGVDQGWNMVSAELRKRLDASAQTALITGLDDESRDKRNEARMTHKIITGLLSIPKDKERTLRRKLAKEHAEAEKLEAL